jgi:hypothetical protein
MSLKDAFLRQARRPSSAPACASDARATGRHLPRFGKSIRGVLDPALDEHAGGLFGASADVAERAASASLFGRLRPPEAEI